MAWSGWRRARGGAEKLVEIELVLVEELCAAGRLSCGPTSAADFCTYASNSRIRHETILLNLMLKAPLSIEISLDAAQGCSSETNEALAMCCMQFASRSAVKTFVARPPGELSVLKYGTLYLGGKAGA